MSWRSMALGELVALRSGGTPSKANAEYWDGDIPWVSSKDMKSLRLHDTQDHISEVAIGKGTRLVEANTILMVVRSMILAKELPVSITSRQMAFNQDIKAILPNDLIDNSFLLYVLLYRRDDILGLVDEAGHGTSRIQTDRLLSLPVPLPPLSIQSHVASVLRAYDDLIEVNQRRIAVLEKMARGLFEEWFVRFRFPGYEEVPILDTPDGPLPKGWAWGTIGEVSRIIKSGSTPSRKERTYWEDGVLEWFTTGELNNGFLFSANERVSKIAVDANKVRVFPVGTVFIALYGATIGALGIAAVECSSNQAALGLVPDGVRMRRWQLFHTLAHLKGWFISVGQGAAQQNISKEKVAAAKVALPPARISELFDRIAAPLWELRSVVERQISDLSASRDLLLPRLISGQLSVTQAERELEEAA